MRLGCCGKIENASVVKSAGFDFIEVSVREILKADLSDPAWSATAPDPAKLPLPMEAANGLLPASHALVGPGRDLNLLKTYMTRVGQRAGRMGITRIVFGAGGARKRPEGTDPEVALAQIAEFCKIAGDACGPHGVMIVIEHLNARETNTLNKLAQARELMQKVNHPAVTMLVDTYHYGLEHEQDEAVLKLGQSINHVHLAEPVDRIQPGGHGEGSPKAFDFFHFFCLLHKVGYDQRLSFEGRTTGPMAEVAPPMIRMLRQTWEASGKAVEG